MSEGILIKGSADIEVRNKSASLKMKAHNTISVGAKRRMLAGAIGEMFRGHAYSLGDSVVEESFQQLVPTGTSTYYPWKTYSRKKALSCALVNLTDEEYQEIASSNAKSFLPLLTSGCLVDINKVKAYSNILDTNPENSVEGYGLPSNVAINNLNAAGKKYMFPAGVGLGTSNGVAMIPGSWIPGKLPCGGSTMFKAIEHFSSLNIAGMNSILSAPGMLSNPDLIYVQAPTPYWVNVITGEKIDDFGEVPLTIPTGVSGSAQTYAFIKVGNIVYGSHATTSSYGIKTLINNNGTISETSTINIGNGKIAGSMAYNSETGDVMDCMVSQQSSLEGGMGYSYNIVRGTTRQSYNTQLGFAAFKSHMQTDLGIDISGLGWVDSSNHFVDSRMAYILPQTLLGSSELTALIVGMRLDTRDVQIVETVFIFNSKTCSLSTLVDIIPFKMPFDMLWANSNGHYGLVRLGRESSYSKSASANYLQLRVNGVIGSAATTAGTVTSTASIQSNMNAIDIGAPKMLWDDDTKYKEADNGLFISHEGMWTSWISCLKMPNAVDKDDETTIAVEYKYAIQ